MMYKFIGSHLPKKARDGYKALVEYAEIDMDAESLLGFIVIFGALFSAAITVLFHIILGFSVLMFAAVAAVVYVIFILASYMIPWFSVESKANFVDSILPDALNIMSVNIRSGLTTDRAFILSARPEFGPLEKQINDAGKRMMSGTEIREALLGMTRKIKSDLFDKTIKLIVEGIESGGQLSRLLDQTAQDIQKTKTIEAEVKASIMMYVFFIFFAAGIGVPVIYGISTNLVGVMAQQTSQIDIASISSVKGAFGGLKFTGISSVSVEPEFLVIFALLAMVVTSIFAGMIIGLIRNGKEKAGMKYIPIILIVSMVLFFVTKTLIAGILPAG